MSTKKVKEVVVIGLYEKVNVEVLLKLLSSDELDLETKDKLKCYFFKIVDDYKYTSYFYDKEGNLCCDNEGLHNYKQCIQHALCKDIYWNINMINMHPNFVSQYCHKNNVNCPQLDNYIKDSEKILDELQQLHHIDKYMSENLIIDIIYGKGYNYVDKHPFIVNLEKELTIILTAIDNFNKKVISIENQCFKYIKDYLITKGFRVGALCLNGLLVERNNMDINAILIECIDDMFLEKSYKVKFSIKSLDDKLPFALPEISKYVLNDLDAQINLFKIAGQEKFKYCLGDLYIFNEKTGMYDTQVETLYKTMIKYKSYLNYFNMTTHALHNYTDNARSMTGLVPFIKAASMDNDWLENTAHSSLGYLLFNNGIYNMHTGEFKNQFDSSIVFHHHVPHDFVPRNINDVKVAQDYFDSIFVDSKAMIFSLARALAGDINWKKYFFCPGEGDSGKSKLISALQIAFGTYVGTFNAESFAYNSFDSTDEAAKNRWSLLLRYSRILVSNEVNMKKILDGNAIKKHSSGADKIVARTHQKEEVSFSPHYTIFCMLNDIPKIEPVDNALVNRLRFIEFPYIFKPVVEVKNSIDTKYKICDENLDAKLRSKPFVNGLIHLLCDAFLNFKKNNMEPEFDQKLKDEWLLDVKQSVKLDDVFSEYFQITNNVNDEITVAELNQIKSEHSVFKTMSARKFNAFLKEQGAVQHNDGKKRLWQKIIRISM